MEKKACIFILCISLAFVTNAQKKTSEHKIKDVSGIGIGGESQSLLQVKQKAINDAKVNSLKKAGIEENINAYSDYFRSETENKMEELFTSDILSNINGTVKNVDVIVENPGVTPEGQLKYDVKINCTVVKYKTKKDLSFGAWVDGIEKFYKVGDGLAFAIKPTQNCYVRAFMFTDDSYILLPNDYEESNTLLAQTEYQYPNPTLIESYELIIEDEKKDRELNRLVIVLLKQDIYYTGGVNYKEITDWIMSIPPDERMIESFSFEIYRE